MSKVERKFLGSSPGTKIYVTDDRPYMIILDPIRPFRSYMVRPYMV